MISEYRKRLLLETLDRNAEELQYAVDERPDLDPRTVRHLLLIESIDMVGAILQDIQEMMP